MKKYIFTIFIVLFGISLVACNTDNNSLNTDIVNVNSNNIKNDTNNFYKEITQFNKYSIDYMIETYEAIGKGNIDVVTKEDLLNKTSNFLVQLKTFSPIPVTTEDEIFYDEYKDMLYDMKKYAEYVQQYLIKKEEVYKSFIRDSYKNVEGHLDVLEIMEKQYYQ